MGPRTGITGQVWALLMVQTLLLSSCLASAPDTARGGVLDGVTALAGGGLLSLAGEWEHFPGVLASPQDLAGRKGGQVRVPGVWDEVVGFDRLYAPPLGQGTLRLTIKLPPGTASWAIRLPNSDSASRLFINGTVAADSGRVGPDNFLPSNRLAIVLFQAEDSLELVWQIANQAMPKIGPWDAPTLGTQQAIMDKRRADVMATSLAAGAMFMMGLYHLGLTLVRRRDSSALLFGLICIFMTIRTLMMGERLLLPLFPPTFDGWAWAYRIEHLSAHMVLPLFTLFFRQLFPREVKAVPTRIIVTVGLVWAALILFTPPLFHQRFLHWYEYAIVASAVYIFVAAIRAALRRQAGTPVILVGMAAIFATTVNDVLLSVGLLPGSFYMSSYGVFIYLFCQSQHLAMLFSRAFREVAILSDTLLVKNRELDSLHTIDLAIASNEDLDHVLRVILDQAVTRLGVDAADVLLYDEAKDELSLAARIGFRTEALLHTRLHRGQGFAGMALQSDLGVVVDDPVAQAEEFNRSPAFAQEGFVFYAGWRLVVKNKPVGVLEVFRRTPLNRQDHWLQYFKTLAGQAAIALDNSTLLQELKDANTELQSLSEATIEGWALALELRDQETEGHSRRVTEATLALADRFGIPAGERRALRWGALLHDIGKMGIPDSILLKPGPLTEEEYGVMKRHPTIARDLLSRVGFLGDALDIPYSHHERWDGSGYPQGLKGTQIPLAARLFTVIDVWDALSSDRPYRKAMAEADIFDHLQSLAGSHFDPAVVAAFLEWRTMSR